MGKLEHELDRKIKESAGSGFGNPSARDQHNSEIELLRFKISQKNNFLIAIISSAVGALVSALVTITFHLRP